MRLDVLVVFLVLGAAGVYAFGIWGPLAGRSSGVEQICSRVDYMEGLYRRSKHQKDRSRSFEMNSRPLWANAVMRSAVEPRKMNNAGRKQTVSNLRKARLPNSTGAALPRASMNVSKSLQADRYAGLAIYPGLTVASLAS